MIKILENKQGGFTLIEIIITLVIGAVVATTLVQYLGSAFTKSSIPIQRLNQALELQQVMENITEDYLENFQDDLPGLRTKLGSPGAYGTSYTVAVRKFVKFTSQIEDNTPDPGNPKKLLKVTIENNLGETLTTLFSLVE